MYGLTTRRPGAASMGSHGVVVERRAEGGGFIAAAVVAPGEPVRLSASGVATLGGFEPATFTVTGPGGPVLQRKVWSNLSGNAWVDWVAPTALGVYRVVVRAPKVPWGFHDASTTFSVAADAPPPPAGGGGGPLGGLGDLLKNSGWLLVGLAALAAANSFRR